MREGRNVADHQPCPRGSEPRGLQVGAAIEVAIEECGSGSGPGDVDRHAVCLDEADVGVEPLVRRTGHAVKQPRRRCCLDGDLQLWLFVNERANQLDAARGMAKPMAGYVKDDYQITESPNYQIVNRSSPPPMVPHDLNAALMIPIADAAVRTPRVVARFEKDVAIDPKSRGQLVREHRRLCAEERAGGDDR
jgi:hypothetical protein